MNANVASATVMETESRAQAGTHLQPVHQARNRVELARDHGEPQDDRPQPQNWQPPEESTEDDKRRVTC